MSYQLDELQKDGANAIIFQVRPECDALYESSIESWSRFLSGQQGSEKEAEAVVSSIPNSKFFNSAKRQYGRKQYIKDTQAKQTCTC